jgi:MerR family mercuric resistance operon transcriptional regulator
MTEAMLTSGRVARAAGVHVETVHYYQRRGLMGLPAKRARGFRYYAPEIARRVRFIKRAQALGMSLEEALRLLKLGRNGDCKETRSLAVAKLALIESKLVDLARLRDVLQKLVTACDQPHDTGCPIIEELEGA